MLRAIAIACDQVSSARSASLWLVTHPSGATPDLRQGLDVAGACVWGVARSLANEEPQLTVRRISLRGDQRSRGRPPAGPRAREPCDEDEIVLTQGGRFVARLVDLEPAACSARDGSEVPFALSRRAGTEL